MAIIDLGVCENQFDALLSFCYASETFLTDKLLRKSVINGVEKICCGI